MSEEQKVKDLDEDFAKQLTNFLWSKSDVSKEFAAGGKTTATASHSRNIVKKGMGAVVGIVVPEVGKVLKEAAEEGIQKRDNFSTREKHRKIFRIIPQDKDVAQKMFLEAAVKIFRIFEYQFSHVQTLEDYSERRAMAKLADDAVERVINYVIAKYEELKRKQNFECSSDFIVNAVLRGSSSFEIKGKKLVNISSHTLWLTDVHDYGRTNELFEFSGYYLKDKDGNEKFYELKEGNKSTKYGYKRLLPFDYFYKMIENNDKWKETTKWSNGKQQEYKYKLEFSEEDIQKRIEELFYEMKEKEPTTKGDLVEIKEGLGDVSQEVQNSKSEMEKGFVDVRQGVQNVNMEIKECIGDLGSQLSAQMSTIQNLVTNKCSNSECPETALRATEIEGISTSYLNRNTRKHANISKWWLNKKRLTESLLKRKHGDKLLVEELYDRIQRDKNRTVVICESAKANEWSGMGGVGKTLTSKWYACRYEEDYDHILWIDCGEGSLIESFKSLARDLEVKHRGELKNVEELATKCFESLSEAKCLWIYDNAESYKEKEGIIKVLPNHQNFFCLITSRCREWGIENIGYGKISDFQLGIFSQEESLEFLRTNLKVEIKYTESELNKLCQELSNLPLALQLAVAALNSSHMEVKTYIQKSKIVKELDKGFDDYEKTINGNVKVSLDLIEKENFGRTAIEILMIFGYIQPDDIQIEFFKWALQIEDEIKESVKLLKKYSLVAKSKRNIPWYKEKEIFLSIHRLLQQIIRHNGKEKEKEIVRKILGCEGFISYKLLPFTKYADEDLKKEFPKVKAQLLDQQQLKKLNGEERFEECVQLSKFIDQELQKPATKLNYAICLHENGQLEECVKTAKELLAEFPLTVKDGQLSTVLEQMLFHLKTVDLTVDIKRNYRLMDLEEENNERLREEVGDLLLFFYLRLNKFVEAIAIGQQIANQERIFVILTAVMAQKKFEDSVKLSKLIDEESKTKTTKLNYAICLQKNGQWKDSVATLNELDQQEIKEKVEYEYGDIEMGLLRLDVEVSRELVGGHLFLAVGTMDNKQKIEDLVKKRKQFRFIHLAENLSLLTRHLIDSNYCLVKDRRSSFIDLNLDVETKKIDLGRCSLSLDSFNRLFPEVLSMNEVSFFCDGQELEEVKLNDFFHFTNIRRLTLNCGKYKKNLSVDLSGDVSIDFLWLENVEVLNWSSCKWKVKYLYLENIPFKENTNMQVQKMAISDSSLDASCLPSTLLKLNLKRMSEVSVSGGVGLPNFKHLTLELMSDAGCLYHFHSATLTHIHLQRCKGVVNVNLMPSNLTHLRITKYSLGDIRFVGRVRNVDNLILEDFSFEGVEECLRHLNTDNLLIYSYIKAKYLVELMEKEIKTITVGRIQWGKDEFQNYSSQLDRESEFYSLKGGSREGMEREDFLKLKYEEPLFRDLKFS